MKVRNHRKLEWWFRPTKSSSLEKYLYIFKYKSELLRFLNNNFEQSLNGVVTLGGSSFGESGAIREWFVWYNDYTNSKKLKIELRQLSFRGRKYIFKPQKIAKTSKKYFAFSKKVISLMCNIYQEDGKTILKKDAEKLITLFHKRGFKDFEPSEDDWKYIEWHISDGIRFYYWSDRCTFLRCKVILEYFKRENLI